jgi:hypothetical protein
MHNFNTVVLERLKDFSSNFETEPYEAAWAREAIFFIRVHDIQGANAALRAYVQLSVDGIDWIDEGTAFSAITQPGSHFVRVSHFGGWLRLRVELDGDNPTIRTTIHLALKA